jgi:pyruvate/2-oxoacid:ferredoxin oxidoreductase alpha subunit
MDGEGRMKQVVDTANNIAGEAAKYARVQVVAAYPITPQTQVVEQIQKLISQGKFDADFITVESEHSAMAACAGASATGIRTFTATSSHGLLFMHEMMHWTALARLPIVMTNINRVVGPGWNIWADHQDAMAQRDTGWLQFYCASNQEVFDTIIQAYKIGENQKVQLPVMVNYDAFVLSHTAMPVYLPEQKDADEFLPRRKPLWKLDPDKPVTHGNIITPDYYFELRKDMSSATQSAKEVIRDACREWKEKTGFWHGDLVENYKVEDAEYIVLALGTLAAEARVAIDSLREGGIKAGLCKIRCYRPFPEEDINRLPKNAKLIVLDRALSFGSGGMLTGELKQALYDDPREIYSWYAGIGGRDVRWDEMEQMVRKVYEGKAKKLNWQEAGKGAIEGFV